MCILARTNTGTCPTNSSLINGVCITEYPALSAHCGLDRDLNNGTCQSLTSGAIYPAYACQADPEHLIGNVQSGQCTDKHSQLITCPAGSFPSANNDECIALSLQSDPNVSSSPCPSDQVLVNGVCSGITTVAKTCPVNENQTAVLSETSANECVVTQTSVLTCPTGFTYSFSARKCINDNTSALVDNVICDVEDPTSGNARPDLSTGECLFVFETPAVCPSGTQEVFGVCMKTHTQAVNQNTCMGTIDPTSNECVTRSTYVPECPDGTTPSKTDPLQCDVVEAQPIHCEQGAYDYTQNVCVSRQLAPVSCDDPNYTYDKTFGTCIFVFPKPDSVCPDDSLELNNLQCYRTSVEVR
jgi:hypothetical protein